MWVIRQQMISSSKFISSVKTVSLHWPLNPHGLVTKLLVCGIILFLLLMYFETDPNYIHLSIVSKAITQLGKWVYY